MGKYDFPISEVNQIIILGGSKIKRFKLMFLFFDCPRQVNACTQLGQRPKVSTPGQTLDARRHVKCLTVKRTVDCFKFLWIGVVSLRKGKNHKN